MAGEGLVTVFMVARPTDSSSRSCTKESSAGGERPGAPPSAPSGAPGPAMRPADLSLAVTSCVQETRKSDITRDLYESRT